MASNIEAHGQQTDFNTVTSKGVTAYHTAETTAVTGEGTLSINASDPIPLTNIGVNEFEASKHYTTSALATEENPTDGSYVYTLPTSSGNKTVTITGPGGTFESLAPTALTYSFSNTVGSTSTSGFTDLGGTNRLRIETDDLSSFSVNYTAFSAATQGGNFTHWLNVEKNGNPTRVVEYDTPGPVASSVAAAENFTVNFVRGYEGSSAFDGASNSYTIGYGAAGDNYDASFYMETGYTNLFTLSDAGLGDGTVQAMGFGRFISMNLQFVSSSNSLYGGLLAAADGDGDFGYTISGQNYILSANNQLVDSVVDSVAKATYLDVENAQVKILGTNTYSGGTGLYDNATVVAGNAGSLGTGVIQLHDESRLVLGFEATQGFVNRITATTNTETPDAVSVLQLAAGYTEANLNFTGRGDLALEGSSLSFTDGEFERKGTAFAGTWTPLGDVYRVGNDLAGYRNGFASPYHNTGVLILENDNALTNNGATARRLEVSGTNLHLEGINSYTGGTQVNRGGTLFVFATGALGTGAVNITDGAHLGAGGEEGSITTIANAITVKGGSSLGVNPHSKLTGSVTLDNTGAPGPYTAFYLDGGEFAGTLAANTGSYIGLHRGNFSGSLTLAPGQNHFVRLGDFQSEQAVQHVHIHSAITLNAGDRLDAKAGNGSVVLHADLTLNAGTHYDLTGVITLSDGADAFLNGAKLHLDYTLFSSDQADFLRENSSEEQVFFVIAHNSANELISGTFSLDELFVHENGDFTGLDVRMEDRIFGEQTMYSVVISASASAVPEPSTYAAIFGGVALIGAAVYRRRRSA